MDEENTDTRSFNNNVTTSTTYLYNITCFNEVDLNTHITMKTPGRTFTKVRAFKFSFNYLFAISSRSKQKDDDEKNTNLKNNIRMWLEMSVPRNEAGVVDVNYIKAGLRLFSMYGVFLHSKGMIIDKK